MDKPNAAQELQEAMAGAGPVIAKGLEALSNLNAWQRAKENRASRRARASQNRKKQRRNRRRGGRRGK